MKIIDKINAAIEEKRTMFSFEYFPPKTDEGKATSLTLQDPIQPYIQQLARFVLHEFTLISSSGINSIN